MQGVETNENWRSWHPSKKKAFLQRIQELNAEKGSHYEYRQDPNRFCVDILKVQPWSRQQEILQALAADNARVTVRSCNGVGKTALAAWIALWFLYAFKPCRVVTTATKLDQLRNGLWSEIRKAHEASGLPGCCDALQLRLSADQFAIGTTARDPTSFQGIRAAHTLVVVDEASGVEESIHEAISSLLTAGDARLLLIGNPLAVSGTFYESHTRLRHFYTPFHISAFDSPNFTNETCTDEVKAALISKRFVETAREQWGEETPIFKARILGQFPDQTESSLIALSWIDIVKDYEPEAEGRIELGADIARHGGCESVAAVRSGDRLLALECWRSSDLMETTGRIKNLGESWGASVYRIDSTGLGAGVADRLKEQELNTEAIFVGERANDPERFTMLRDEMWWNLRERIREKRIGPIQDDKLQAQLTSIRFKYDSKGRIKIEAKADMEKRAIKSPDRADALALAFMDTNPCAWAEPIEPDDSYFEADRNIMPW